MQKLKQASRFVLDGEKVVRLKKLFWIFQKYVDELCIKIGKEGWNIVFIDPTNVCLFDFKLKAENFIEYHTKNQRIGFNLKFLIRVLRRVKKEDVVNFEVVDNRLKINIKCEWTSHRVFEIPLVEIEKEDKKPVLGDYPYHITVDNKELSVVLKSIKKDRDGCESVYLELIENRLWIFGEGFSERVNGKLVSYRTTEETINRLRLEHLKNLNNSLYEKVEIRLKREYPATFVFENDFDRLEIIIAPREVTVDEVLEIKEGLSNLKREEPELNEVV